MSKVFSYREFYLDLNRQRRMRGNISWNKVASRSGMTQSSLHMFVKQFTAPDTDANTLKVLSLHNVVKLLDWMQKTDLAPYMVDEDA